MIYACIRPEYLQYYATSETFKRKIKKFLEIRYQALSKMLKSTKEILFSQI